MKTFEERYTAWIDGKLEGAELLAFERELEAGHPEAASDRQEAHGLGTLLRQHGVSPDLGNGDFFNLQLLERIAAEERTARPALARQPFRWALPHLAWGAVCCLLLCFTTYKTWVAPSQQALAALATPVPAVSSEHVLRATYSGQVLDAHPADPSIYATPLHSSKDGVTVLWLDGLDYLPATYELQ